MLQKLYCNLPRQNYNKTILVPELSPNRHVSTNFDAASLEMASEPLETAGNPIKQILKYRKARIGPQEGETTKLRQCCISSLIQAIFKESAPIYQGTQAKYVSCFLGGGLLLQFWSKFIEQNINKDTRNKCLAS